MKKKILNKLMITAVPVLAHGLIRFIAFTMKTVYLNFEGYKKIAEKGEQVIIAFWHGRLLMMPYAYMGKNGVSILVSQSKDGELIARTIKGFGIESVRGSSTRGWVSGVKGLLKAVQSGRDVAITPDGPKGPKMKAQLGAIQIARVTGLKIIPIAFGASKKKFLGAGIPSSYPILFPKGSLSTASL